MKVYAFVGPSGTGKSYRAQMVANQRNIEYIIDDGLLIKGSAIIAGTSAKKASTKVETVRHALFQEKGQKDEIDEVMKKYNIDSIMILGTSDNMVQKIAANLGFPEISEYIYIQDVATEEEMETARNIRIKEGKHVIPVPTFELKKDFSGYLLDPLQIFKLNGKDQKPYVAEKSIIRPTFSYLGKFKISDVALRQIIELSGKKIEGVVNITRVRIDNSDLGMTIYAEVTILYGFKMMDLLRDLRSKIKKDVEKLTGMYVEAVQVVAKSIIMPENKE